MQFESIRSKLVCSHHIKSTVRNKKQREREREQEIGQNLGVYYGEVLAPSPNFPMIFPLSSPIYWKALHSYINDTGETLKWFLKDPRNPNFTWFILIQWMANLDKKAWKPRTTWQKPTDRHQWERNISHQKKCINPKILALTRKETTKYVEVVSF